MSTSLRTLAEIEHDLIHSPARRRDTVAGVIPSSGITVMFGASGGGKTGLAVWTAIASSTGLHWADRQVEQAAVLYIAGEDYRGVEGRLVAASRVLGVKTADIPLAIIEPHTKGIVGDGFFNATAAEADKLKARFGRGLGLIVIDTLGACFGDESQDDARPASKAMGVLDQLSRRYECPVLLIHHTGKSGDSMRGSQVFYDRADAVISVKRSETSSKVKVEKLKNAPDGALFAFDITGHEIVAGGETISMQVIQNLRSLNPKQARTPNPEAAKPRKIHEQALDVLLEISPSGRVLTKTWKEALYARWSSKTATAKSTAFSDAKAKLLSECLVRENGKFVSACVSENSADETLTVRTSQSDLSASASATPSLKEGVPLTKQPSASIRGGMGVPKRTAHEARTGTGG